MADFVLWGKTLPVTDRQSSHNQRNQSFDAVVHLAALAGVQPSIDRQLDYEITNVLGTIRLLDFCRRMAPPLMRGSWKWRCPRWPQVP